MADQTMPGRFSHQYGALGFLRLLFASLVIVSHTPDLVDGNADRDVLVRVIGGRLTSGGVAVSGFFIISGFLITASYLSRPDARAFMTKRITRIYPAFAVMFLICLFVVRPIGGGSIDGFTLASFVHEAAALVTLHAPEASGAFANLPHPSLNGAIWTLPCEFYCYVLVLGLGTLGVLDRPRIIIAMAIACLLLNDLGVQAGDSGRVGEGGLALLHALQEPFRLIGLFLAGASFFLMKRPLSPRPMAVALAALGLIVCLLVPLLVNTGLALFGTYLIFAVAQAGGKGPLGKINTDSDISYGLYIYAWPIEQLLITRFGGSSLLFLGTATWLLAAAMGWLSWTLVERPVLRWLREDALAPEAIPRMRPA